MLVSYSLVSESRKVRALSPKLESRTNLGLLIQNQPPHGFFYILIALEQCCQARFQAFCIFSRKNAFFPLLVFLNMNRGKKLNGRLSRP